MHWPSPPETADAGVALSLCNHHGKAMRQIAVINQKGGVGKTTTTANLGAALALSGRRVLLVDLDPQAHLTLHYGAELVEDEPSVYDVLIDGRPVDEVVRPVGENLLLLPAHIDLAGAETELVSVVARETLLRRALTQATVAYDVLLIDCPPSLGVLTINALVACSEVLIPLQAHFLALQGLSRLLQTVALVRERINPRLRVGGIALCMHEATTKLASEVVDDLRRFLESARDSTAPWSDACVYRTCVRRNIKLAEAASFGQTIFTYAPRSNGALDYADLAHEVLEHDGGGAVAGAEPAAATHPAPEPPPLAMAPVAEPAVPAVTDAAAPEARPVESPARASGRNPRQRRRRPPAQTAGESAAAVAQPAPTP
ncbi:MAG TPA: AAA family ATPase [Phycisphaerae bacterium]|nr:AAA family ATPase [Phycisphaerae bacterium]HNU47169.1 AAA family ATPase [Phycisphaerae bacterium]